MVGRIYPECHSSSDRERREHGKRTEEEDEKGIRVSGNQEAGYQKIRVSGDNRTAPSTALGTGGSTTES